MSQWTHITGIIRFEDWNANVWPAPPNKNKVLADNVEFVNEAFQRCQEPTGSEGPLQTDTILTSRGPTVIITGDLRDFGLGDVPEVVSWLNEVKNKHLESFGIRDCLISCDVEGHETLLMIDYDYDSGFYLAEYKKVIR